MLTVTLPGFLFVGKIWSKKLNIASGPKVHKYLEYHSVCPLVGIGTPHPLSCKRVCPPPNQRGGHTHLQVRGWGSPDSDDWRKSLALCLLRVSLKFTHKTTLLDSFVCTLKTKIVDYSIHLHLRFFLLQFYSFCFHRLHA